MKTAKNLFILLTVCALLVTALSGCSPAVEDTPSTDTEPADVGTTVDISKYRIVRPASANAATVQAVTRLKEQIKEYTGAELQIITDDEAKTSPASGGYEILIGACSGDISLSAINKLRKETKNSSFIIDMTGNTIVIRGKNNDDTEMAIAWFINQFVKPSAEAGRLSMEKGDMTAIQETDSFLYLTDSDQIIKLERTSIIAQSENEEVKNERTYGKIIKLEHQANQENNGILLATNENTLGQPWDLYRSDDDGKTWTSLEKVPNTVDPSMTHGYQSYLYELPEDIGTYKKGTLLFAGCSYTASRTTMYLAASTDLGASWKGICNVAEGGGFNGGGWASDGLWEPILMSENGKLYCFYSDELENGEGEAHIGGHNQRLVYRDSSDLVTWSETKEMVAMEDPNLRPGMVALTKMGNGKWALAYEMGGDEYILYIKFADALDAWNAADPGTRILTKAGKSLGSSPAIAWSPNGGECGTLFVIGNGNRLPSSGAVNLFLSFDYGQTFVSIPNPIALTKSPQVRSGYSPGFFVDKDGAVYYVNNPAHTQESNSGDLVMAKIIIE